MSGRIYDYGIKPKCDICNSNMWTSADRNFNGAKCKRHGCNGSAIYEEHVSVSNDIKCVYENGKYILYGAFVEFGKKKINIPSVSEL